MLKSVMLFLDKLEKWRKEKKAWYKLCSILGCFIVFVTVYSLILPAITLVTDDGTIPLTISAAWDNDNNLLGNVSLSIDVTGAEKDTVYTLQYSSDGIEWTNTSISFKSTDNNRRGDPIVFSGRTLETELGDLSKRFRVQGVKKNNISITNSFEFIDVYNSVKAGFEDWVDELYVSSFGGTSLPTTPSELNDAFIIYFELPTATLSVSEPQGVNLEIYASVSVDIADDYQYQWQYLDSNNEWQNLEEKSNTITTINANNYDVLLNGGAKIRCVVYDDTGEQILTSTQSKYVNPLEELYNTMVNNINNNLNLREYQINVGGTLTTADIRIDGEKYLNNFYWTSVANDDNVDFYDAESYKIHLINLFRDRHAYYLNKGKTESQANELAYADVKKDWDYYLYDIYDPNWASKGNITSYPQHTYGDTNLEWPKDSLSSFHTNLTNGVELLNYGLSDDGVDYSNFVKNVEKTVTAVAAGDNNVDRKYDVNIKADVQAVQPSPIAIIFQIQTSWQLFDLAHANSSQKNTPMVENDDLATLYDIKHAIIDFLNYMNNKHEGNNLLIGITEVKHNGSTSMFKTVDYEHTDARGNPSYVYYTNNYDALMQGLNSWDTFGNCELVHYDSNTLVSAVESLPINLEVWSDIYKQDVYYDEIQKDVIIIGGPTEDGSYDITLPWSTFSGSDMDAVYGIRVNDGDPVTTNIISWLDYSGNIPTTGAVPYYSLNNVVGGNTYTKEYYASNREAIYDALIEIAERDMKKKSTNINIVDRYVDDFKLNDVVEDEFEIDYSQNFVSTIKDADDNINYQVTISFTENKVIVNDVNNGSVTQIPATFSQTVLDDDSVKRTVSFEFEQEYQVKVNEDGVTSWVTETQVIPQELEIIENIDGTTNVSYLYNRVFNTKKTVLDFRIQAREDFLGSNNVYTNVGYANVTYNHYKLDSDGNPTDEYKNFTARCDTIPQVNVPIRYSAVRGGSTIIRLDETTDLKNLDSNLIVQDIRAAIRRYDQVNGTVNYTWKLDDGTYDDLGSDIVRNSRLSSDKALNHIFTGNDLGEYVEELIITFTPDEVNPNNPNFANDITKAPVAEQVRSGIVEILVVAGDEKTNIIIKKRWLTPPPDGVTSLETYLYADGVIMKDENNNPIVYILTEENNWETTVYNLPVYVDNHLINYTVEEEEYEDYIVDYRKKNVVVDQYSIRPTFTFISPNDLKNKQMTINYVLDGVAGVAYKNSGDMKKNISSEFEFDEPILVSNPADFDFKITSVVIDGKTYTLPTYTKTNVSGGIVLNILVNFPQDVDTNKVVVVSYKCNGSSGSFNWSPSKKVKGDVTISSSESNPLPDGDYEVTSIAILNNKDELVSEYVYYSYDAGNAFVSGQIITPMLLISNSISVKLPATGGNELIYILMASILMIGSFVYGLIYCIKNRSQFFIQGR